MRAQIDFIFYLVDTPSGLCYYKDAAGRTKKTPITNTNIDSHLKSSPGKWMDQQLSFERNKTYFGINRSYSQPLLFFGEAATMIRELYYQGIGIETPLTLVVYKFNPSGIPSTYNTYYVGQVDLTTSTDTITEGFECNLMEGGLLALIKSYENRVFELPCDGSIPENKKVNLDGWLLPDVLNYQFVPGDNPNTNAYWSIPTVFINNEGDNFGIIHQNQQGIKYNGGNGDPNAQLWSQGGDYLFTSENDTEIEVDGEITLGGSFSGEFTAIAYLQLFLGTSNSRILASDINRTDHTYQLIPAVPGFIDDRTPLNNIGSYYILRNQQTFSFKQKISLKAGEKLFILMFEQSLGSNVKVISGNFQLKINTAPVPTRAWTMTWYDVGRLLLQNICTAASTTDQTFNYGFKSDLLNDNLNLLIACGDSLRASADSNYSRFFNSYNLGDSPTSGLQIEYGPVIKTSLSDFFKATNCMFFASLGNETIDGKEYLYVEKRQYAYNPTDNIMNVGEVANMKLAFMKEFAITGFKIGYQAPSLDQKAGKYEPNTTAEWSINTKATVSNIMDLVSPWSASPVLIQRIISGIGAPTTSTTNNDSDNTVFIINSDPSKQFADYQKFTFVSQITDYNLSSNTNQKLINNNSMQGIGVNNVDGSLFSLNTDPSIFVFSEPTLDGTLIKHIDASFTGFFLGNSANPSLGLPTDSVTIEMWNSGALYYDQTYLATGASTPIAFNPPTLNRLCKVGDSIFFRIKTSLNATGSIETASLTVNNADNSPYWSTTGADILITPGSAVSLIPLPNVTGPLTDPTTGVPVNGSNIPIVSWGFQYYQFNSILNNPIFSYNTSVSLIMNGGTSDLITTQFYKNGAQIGITNNNGLGGDFYVMQQKSYPAETLQLGDLFYILGSTSANANAQVQAAAITFTSKIQVNALKRVQYDYLSGFAPQPSLNGRTDVAGAPFNIEFLTPKRIFERHYPYFRSICYANPQKTILFCSLSKNQYLVTSYQGKIYAENQNVSVSSMDEPYFYPFLISFDVDTSDTFSQAQTGAANSCIIGTENGFNIIGFPEKLSQKPALNETQNWQILCSAQVDLSALINLEYTGLNNFTMLPGTMRSATLNSVKFFPQEYELDPKYRTPDPDNSPFASQVSGWINQDGYANPWYVGYPIPLQFRTNGLSPVKVYLYSCCGDLINTTDFTQKTSPAIINPITLWEGSIDLTGITPGGYYLVAQAGTSSGAFMRSEPLDVRPVDASDRILLAEYKHSYNKQETIFDTGFTPCFYIPGMKDNKGKTSFKGAFYIDQPQDITIENGITYRTFEVHLWQIPDYVIDHLMEIMMCDTVMLEGVQCSLNAQEDPEMDFTKGAPKKNWKLIFRMAKNSTGVSASANGPVQDATLIATLDARATAPNSNNDSGSNEPIITTINITT